MTQADTVRELASILNPQNEARPTILLGAGASFSSGVPLAEESVKRIARRYYAERISGKVLPEQVKTSEWLAWLADQTWFIRDPARLSENFPLAVKHLLTPQAYRQKVLLDLIASEGEIQVEISNRRAFHRLVIEIPGFRGRRRSQCPLLACQLLVEVGEQFVEPVDFAKLEIASQALPKHFDIGMEVAAAMTPEDALLESEITALAE
jgi:hypothetical protein